MKIQLDMYQTIAVAVVVLMLGNFLKRRIRLLERFCIPSPVIGGVIFAIFTCICYVTGIAEFSFDDILKEVCMVFFFTSVGFQANLKVLKSGGKALGVFLILVIGLILSQNFLAVGLTKLLHIDPMVGLCTGSIPMVGGHGTAGAFGPVLEDFGVKGATTICTAGATSCQHVSECSISADHCYGTGNDRFPSAVPDRYDFPDLYRRDDRGGMYPKYRRIFRKIHDLHG